MDGGAVGAEKVTTKGSKITKTGEEHRSHGPRTQELTTDYTEKTDIKLNNASLDPAAPACHAVGLGGGGNRIASRTRD